MFLVEYKFTFHIHLMFANTSKAYKNKNAFKINIYSIHIKFNVSLFFESVFY